MDLSTTTGAIITDFRAEYSSSHVSPCCIYIDRFVENLLVAPVREELIFRAVLYSVFFKRVGGRKGSDRLYCVFASSFVFGLVHLLNLFGIHLHSFPKRMTASYMVYELNESKNMPTNTTKVTSIRQHTC